MKTKVLYIKVTEEEHHKIHAQAKSAGMKMSKYLRSLGLNYPITSNVDNIALGELMKSRGDLGRLGGLLKMWLTSNDKIQATAALGTYSYASVDNLVDDIERRQEELLMTAKRLL